MRHLLTFLLLAASAFAQTATITDTIATPFAGTFSGTVTVSLNSPALAQPLYSGSVTLSGWTQTVTVTAGAFALTLYTNDLITPGGTSYTATYAPTSGSGWKETWIVPSGATTIREIRSTTVPSPSVRFTPSQITQAGATLGQGLRWNGSIWAPAAVLTDPMTTTGDLITRSGINAVRLGIGSAGQVLTVSGGLPVWASGITGNASTATALAANGTNCSAGSFPLGVDASGNAESCTAAVTASTGLSDSADIVRGGAALATVGSVPLVTSSGVLGQNTNFRFFTGTGNLVVGTTTDDGTNRLQVAGSGLFVGNLTVSNQGTNGYLRIFDSTPAASNPAKFLTVASGQLRFYNNAYSGSLMALADNGNLLLGTTTDGNFKLDVADSGSAGGLRVWDQRATIGSTSLVVRGGAGQGANNLTTWQNSGGTEVARVNAGGGMAAQEFFNLTGTFYQNGVNVDVGSGGIYRFASSASQGATKDLSLSRASANTLQVGDGSANSNGTILARIHTWSNGTEGTCDATLRGQVVMVQGGAGVADRLRLCRKDATDTYLWSPVDNNVALQVVSAGPTATVTNQVSRVYVDPASVIASLTLTLPATPLDADRVEIFFGGTLANQAAVVTTLSIAPNTGHAISQFSAPANAFGGDMVTYKYRAAAARWYRIQ